MQSGLRHSSVKINEWGGDQWREVGQSTGGRCRASVFLLEGTMIDEGIYLFFDNETAAQGEFPAPLETIDLSNVFVQDLKNKYMLYGSTFSENDRQDSELRPLSERKFTEYCGKTRLVLFTCIKSITDLELALLECDEMVGRFREIFSKQSLLFVAENWDATFFWTAASIRRWFRTRFPAKPKEVKYAKPPTVTDLLYEFLESVPRSRDNLLTLKETLLVLSAEDRSFVEDILRGKNPKTSAKAQDASARILRALKDTKERII
jgi:hypothetical protein